MTSMENGETAKQHLPVHHSEEVNKIQDHINGIASQSMQEGTSVETDLKAFAAFIAEVKGTDNWSPYQHLKDIGDLDSLVLPEESEPSTPITATPASGNKQAEGGGRERQSQTRDERQLQKRDERRAKKDIARAKLSQPQHGGVTSDPMPESMARHSQSSARTPTTNLPSKSLPVLEASGNVYKAYPEVPEWYKLVKFSKRDKKERDWLRSQQKTSFDSLKTYITRCKMEKQSSKLHKLYEALRDHIHKAEMLLEVDAFMVKKAHILEPQSGLPCIFGDDKNFPSDLRADSYQLYKRWYQGNFKQDLLRGIVATKEKGRTSDRLDEDYRNKFPVDPKVYGGNGLVLGQWWPTQLCTLRDGAHGSAQGGIYGDKEQGAYSIVLSSGGYRDRDGGETIYYMGTDGKDFSTTENTKHLLKSEELGNQVRVIRSYKITQKSEYRPVAGYRYDGLYTVKDHEVVDKEKATYCFRLERCKAQEPIRYGKGAASRPSRYEVEAFERLRDRG